MKFISAATATFVAFSALVSAQGNQKTYDINVSKDSTILRSVQSCPACPNSNCFECTKGAESTLNVNQGGFGANFTILGFTLPSEVIGAPELLYSCTLSLPQPNGPVSAQSTVSLNAADPFWDEYSISANNAPSVGPPIGQLVVPTSGAPSNVDLTQACKNAASKNGAGFSVFLVPNDSTLVTFPSKEAGKPSVLHVTIHPRK